MRALYSPYHPVMCTLAESKIGLLHLALGNDGYTGLRVHLLKTFLHNLPVGEGENTAKSIAAFIAHCAGKSLF